MCVAGLPYQPTASAEDFSIDRCMDDEDGAMARTRAIKPGFFKNEDLAECSPHARLLFAGLWTLADRDGRLEDRPRRIGGEIFPYEQLDIDALLNELAARHFIVRYVSGDFRCIQVIKFGTHQTPHVKEADSTLPAPDGYETSTGLAPDLSDTSIASRAHAPSPFSRKPSPVNLLPSPVETAIPEPLLKAQDVLVPFVTRGFIPDRDNLLKVGTSYPNLDLDLEFRKLADWLRDPKNRKEQCSWRRIFNWLKRAEEYRQTHAHKNGTVEYPPPPVTEPLNGADLSQVFANARRTLALGPTA